jgi:hypothetical protein
MLTPLWLARARKAHRLLIPATLAADSVLFFARPLFSSQYSFPWDFRLVQVPLITFLADQLQNHDLPLWDPYTYCGNPIYANIQACFFHPLVFLAALAGPGSLGRLLEWVVVVQVCAAGWFTYRLARHLGCSRAGAWAAAVICETGPYFASRTEHIGAMMAAAWLPAAWYAVVRLRERMDARMLALLGAALGMSVVGGSPAATTAVFGSTLLLAVILFAVKLARPRTIALTALGCVLGIGVSAVIFIPAAELTQNSVAKYRLDWLGTGGGLKWPSLVSLLIPNYSHVFDLANFKGPGDPTFLYLYSSITGLLFVILVLLFRPNRWVACFAFLGLAGGLFMMGDSLPLWSTLYPLLPERVRIGIHPEFTYCVFGECLALLAGLGISRILTATPALQWGLAAVIALELYFVGSNRPMNCASLRDEPGLSAQPLEQVRRFSALDSPPARIDNTDGVYIAWAEAAPLTRVPTGNGASPLAPERIIQIRLGVHAGGRAGWYYPVENFGSAMLDLMSERYLLVSAQARTQVDANPRYRQVASLPGVLLYENTTSLPRAFVVPAFTQAPFPNDARIIQSPGFDLHREATLEAAPPAVGLGGTGSARFTAYSPNHVAVTASTDGPALLVLSEAWYPGWEARLDGQPVPIHIADATFRGIILPAGTHHVTMDFRPRILIYSAALSLIFLAGLAILYTLPVVSVKQ